MHKLWRKRQRLLRIAKRVNLWNFSADDGKNPQKLLGDSLGPASPWMALWYFIEHQKKNTICIRIKISFLFEFNLFLRSHENFEKFWFSIYFSWIIKFVRFYELDHSISRVKNHWANAQAQRKSIIRGRNDTAKWNNRISTSKWIHCVCSLTSSTSRAPRVPPFDFSHQHICLLVILSLAVFFPSNLAYCVANVDNAFCYLFI